MIRNPLPLILALACLMWTVALSQERTSTQEPPLLTFADLQQNDSVDERFRIEAYVIDISKCPPCPPGAVCKPCIPNNIVVTDDIDEQDLSKIKRLKIFTEKPEQFELKKKYTFTVKIKGKVPSGRAITDVDLISFEPFKEVIN